MFGLLSPTSVHAKNWKSAELITQQTFKYGAFEARIRAAEGSGFISTFFLWKNGSEEAGAKWQEMDFEVWGKNGKVQTQAMTPGDPALGTVRTEHTAIHTLPTLAYDHYYTYRLEWTPKHLAYFINGTLVREETDQTVFAKLLDSTQAEACQLRTGLWAGDADWSGTFDSTKVPQASFVNWIQVHSYTPGAGTGGTDFSLLWRDDFNSTSFDWSRWWTSNWTFDYSVSDYVYANHGFKDGTLIEAFTSNDSVGHFPAVPADDGVDLTVSAGTTSPTDTSKSGTDTTTTKVVNPIAIPSTILATSYARALDVTSGNTGDQSCSTGDVDEEISSDTGGGCDVGWTQPGEWLEYDVASASAATYDVSARLASADGTGKLIVLVDGTRVGDTVTAPSGGWQDWQDIAVGSVKLSAGNHVVRLLIGDPAKFNIRSITFSSDTTVAPAQVTGLAATGDSTGTIDLSWTASSGATAYKIYRGTTGVAEALIATIKGTTYKDSGLVTGLPYTYRVVATNSVGDAPTSSSVTATPQAATLPPTVTDLAAVAGDAQVSLSWTASTGATSYRVYASSVGSDSLRATVTTNSATIGGLTNGIPYTFYVVAANTAGSAAKSSSVSATPVSSVTVPGQVTGLTATLDSTKVTLGWTALTGATSYKVYQDGILVASVSSNSATLSGLSDGTSYSFQVAAANVAGTGAASATVSVVTTPGQVVGLTATLDSTKVTLGWSALTGATSYKVYQNGALVASVSTNSTTLSGLSDGTSYAFYVVGANATGTGAASATVSVLTSLGQVSGLAATASANQVTLNWAALTGATSYKVYQNGTLVASVSSNSTTLSGLSDGTSYAFYVVASNATGTGTASATVSALTAPGQVEGLTATSGANQATLNWAALTGATSYDVYQNGTLVATTSANSVTLSGLSDGTSYTFHVVGVNTTGTGTSSASITVHTPRRPKSAS